MNPVRFQGHYTLYRPEGNDNSWHEMIASAPFTQIKKDIRGVKGYMSGTDDSMYYWFKPYDARTVEILCWDEHDQLVKEAVEPMMAVQPGKYQLVRHEGTSIPGMYAMDMVVNWVKRNRTFLDNVKNAEAIPAIIRMVVQNPSITVRELARKLTSPAS